MSDDTSSLVGGPITRNGGKGLNGPRLLPHFAPAKVYAEAFFGAGGMFFRVPPGTYQREAVNDLDASLMTFFRVLRDEPAELMRLIEATPYARDEFIAALERSPVAIEEARRVWVRGRQGFGGAARSAGDWGRNPGDNGGPWLPSCAEGKREALPLYAARLRRVAIDNIDACEFIAKWGRDETFLYCDPPYVDADDYEHSIDHRALAAACVAAVARGCKVAVSGYPSVLYEELFAGWRRVEHDVALIGTRDATGKRRTECLWMSYPEAESFAGIEAAKRSLRQPSLF